MQDLAFGRRSSSPPELTAQTHRLDQLEFLLNSSVSHVTWLSRSPLYSNQTCETFQEDFDGHAADPTSIQTY